MQVINISNAIFKAGNTTSVKNPIEGTHKKVNVKEILYDDIDAFIKKEIDHNEYISRFMAKIENRKKYKNFSKVEKDYIQQLVITIDSVKNNDDIYPGYLNWLIKNILKYNGSEKQTQPKE